MSRRWRDPWTDRLSAGSIGPVPAGPHAHPHLELNLLEAGRMCCRIGPDEIELAPGRLVVFAAVQPHAVTSQGRDAKLLWLTVPLGQALAWSGFAGRTRLLLSGRVAVAERNAGDGEAMRRWLALLRRNGSDDTLVVALEVEARLRRLLREEAGAGAAAGDAVQRMLGHLATRYRGPCPLAEVARSGGLCRSAAAVAFKRATGSSIHVHLVRLRLAHARGLLADGAPVAEAAFAAGFGSLGRFYAAWSAAYATPPRNVRT